jgi:hypothetical protein
MKQMELVYNQEYQLQLLERKISRAQGERSNEEKAALAAKIHTLTKELEAGSQTGYPHYLCLSLFLFLGLSSLYPTH